MDRLPVPPLFQLSLDQKRDWVILNAMKVGIFFLFVCFSLNGIVDKQYGAL